MCVRAVFFRFCAESTTHSKAVLFVSLRENVTCITVLFRFCAESTTHSKAVLIYFFAGK